MPFDLSGVQALVLIASAIMLTVVTKTGRVHPFVALVVLAVAFAYAAQLRSAVIAHEFGVGFSSAIYNPGLVIIAAAFISGLAETTGLARRLTDLIEHLPAFRIDCLAGMLGLLGGLGASASGAFALLSPLLQPISGNDRAHRQRAALTLALALSASRGVAVLSPVAIASISILGADWVRTALFGPPLAIVLAAFGALGGLEGGAEL